MTAVPLADIPESVEPACPWLPVARNRYREEAADYPALVAMLNPGWRVIECRDGIQWILQRQAGKRHGQPRWEAKQYLRAKDALIRAVHKFVGQIDDNALRTLEALPERLRSFRIAATAEVTAKAEGWLAATPPRRPPTPIVPATREMFGLTALEACQALREADLIKARAG